MKKINLLHSIFKTNESKFELRTALKVSLVPLLGLGILALQFRVFLQSIYFYFKANRPDLVSLSESTFIDAIFTGISDVLPYFLLYFVIVFFIGLVVSLILLHPIAKIKQYCNELSHNSEQKDFSVSGLEHGRLLDRISYTFFNFIKNQKEHPDKVPLEAHQSVTRPPFEWTSYIQYYSIILIIMFASGALLNIILIDVYSEVIAAANSYLDSTDKTLNAFLNGQRDNLDFIFVSTVSTTCLFYIVLGQNLISNISGVSFAFFRTMRDIMTGNHKLRVHLRIKDPGHNAADELNKLLDQSL